MGPSDEVIAEDRERAAAHEREGWRVLHEYEDEGKPFILYLRNFDPIDFRGQDPDNLELPEEQILRRLPDGVNLLSVQSHDSMEVATRYVRKSVAIPVPAVVLRQEGWREAVRAFIYWADLIILDISLLSGGVRGELETCHELGKRDYTVLITPGPPSVFQQIDEEPLVREFPRWVWSTWLHYTEIMDHFVTRDLLDRIAAIGVLDRRRRLELKDPEKRQAAFPVRFDVLLDGLFTNATGMLELYQREAKRPNELGWLYVFWSLHRFRNVLGQRYAGGNADALGERRWALAEVYLCDLLLECGLDEGRKVYYGDIEYASAVARTAVALCSRFHHDLAPVALELMDCVAELRGKLLSGEVERRPRLPEFEFTANRL